MIVTVLRRVGALFAIVLAVLATLVAAGAAVLASATISAVPAVFLGTGWLVMVGGVIATVAIATRGRPARRPAVALAAVALSTALAAPAVLAPLEGDAAGARPVAGLEYVTLPTGSTLAYVRIPARPRATHAPIVYVHGGPGVADMAGDAAVYSRLADLGRDVILYDQVGAGHSSRLADPSEYTLERDRADLVALLGALGVDRFVLVGHSYGATLGAAFMARRPDRVEAAAFIAPGAVRIHERAYGTGMVDRLDDAQRVRLSLALFQPRALLAWSLSQVNLRAARAFAGDSELDARYDRTYALSEPGLYCGTPPDRPSPTGLGFYTNAHQRAIPDLRPALAAVGTPTLVVKPQCDYLPWSFATDIVRAMPDAALVYVRGAGHSVHLEQPHLTAELLRAFLSGEPLPVPPQHGLTPPADFEGPLGT